MYSGPASDPFRNGTPRRLERGERLVSTNYCLWYMSWRLDTYWPFWAVFLFCVSVSGCRESSHKPFQSASLFVPTTAVVVFIIKVLQDSTCNNNNVAACVWSLYLGACVWVFFFCRNIFECRSVHPMPSVYFVLCRAYIMHVKKMRLTLSQQNKKVWLIRKHSSTVSGLHSKSHHTIGLC